MAHLAVNGIHEAASRSHKEVIKKFVTSTDASDKRKYPELVSGSSRLFDEGEFNLLDVVNDAKRVFNTDESGFLLCPKGDHVLVRKGSKMVFNFVMNDDKECLTALIGGNAAGDLMPPRVVYPYQRVPAVISELFQKTWAIVRSIILFILLIDIWRLCTIQVVFSDGKKNSLFFSTQKTIVTTPSKLV